MEVQMTSNRLMRFIGNLFRRNNFIKNQLYRIRKFSLTEILQDALAKITFKKYLKDKYLYGTEIILLFWQTYNMCDKLQWKTLDLSDKIVKKLERACPAYTEEGLLILQLKEYKKQNNEVMMTQVINEIKATMISRMEDCYACKVFMYDLRNGRKKIRQCIGEIYDMLEDVKDELNYFLMNLMEDCLR